MDFILSVFPKRIPRFDVIPLSIAVGFVYVWKLMILIYMNVQKTKPAKVILKKNILDIKIITIIKTMMTQG